jgi:hypothetical protein
MNHEQSQQVLKLFSQREYELKVEQRAFEIYLGVLEPFGAFSKGCGIVLPLLAGFTLLGQSKFLGGTWELISGSLSLMAAILTGIHTGLKCDDHQAECRRLIKELQSLVEGYQAAMTVDESELKDRRSELENRLKELRGRSDIRPARWCTQCAKRQLSVRSPIGYRLS